jgi:quercetin dioxygenase-like cupin family protein
MNSDSQEVTSYPRTIDDGGGSAMTFVGVSTDETGAEHLSVVSRVAPGHGPPSHVHHLQDEQVTVREGRIGWAVTGEPEQFAGPGETVRFAAGVEHRFWNAGDEDLVCEGSVSPPDNFEWFLTQVYASTKANDGTRPGLFDSAFLMTRYRSEFAMTDIPKPITAVLFPIIAAVGRLFGRADRYAAAPQPLPEGKPSAGSRLTEARADA